MARDKTKEHTISNYSQWTLPALGVFREAFRFPPLVLLFSEMTNTKDNQFSPLCSVSRENVNNYESSAIGIVEVMSANLVQA